MYNINYWAYWDLFEQTVENDPVLSKYEKDLGNRSDYISHLMVSATALEKISQPFRLIRTYSEQRKISAIQTEYKKVRGTSLVENFDEESGELDHDFYAAATFFKPRRLKKFAKEHPITTGDEDKLLKLKKTM